MKTGLVMEGGALRTIFSCGVCDAFLDADLPMPDFFVGVSGGIAYGASFLTRQNRRNLKLLTTYANDTRYMSWRNMAARHNKSFFGLKFAYETIPNQLLPFDYEAFEAYPGTVEAVLTNLETGKAEYWDVPRTDRTNLVTRASCSIPLMFPIATVEGKPYLDGGCADAIPWKRAFDAGCDRVVVLLTRERAYRKEDDKTMKVIEQTFRKYPAFVETMRINTSVVRRHLRTPDLQLYQTTVGRRSLTNVTVAWIRGITNETLVQKMRQRLDAIDIDALLSPSAVEEYVTGSRVTTFPLLQYTERADRFCQGLLDGRVGLLVDGLPLGYLAPTDIGYLMESMEDRSRDFISASCVRALRYGALLVSLLLPAIYIALINFHPQWIPEALRNTIMNTKQPVPFSAAGEVLGLLIAYELLQESGIHLPQAIGQSVSTIGGIVVGTAAVEAGLISPVVLIVVSIAGVCGFVLPNRDLANAIRAWRFGFGIFAAVGGMIGVGIGMLALVLHLFMLKSLGVRYIRIRRGRNKGILRQRLKNQKYRDDGLHPKDERNQK